MGDRGGEHPRPVVAVRVVSDADLGTPEGVQRPPRRDSAAARRFRAAWVEQVAASLGEPGRAHRLLATPEQPGQIVPLAALLEPSKPDYLVLAATNDFTATLGGPGSVVDAMTLVLSDEATSPFDTVGIKVVVAEVDAISLTSARRGVSEAMAQIARLTREASVARLLVGAGANELTLGTLLGCLETAARVDVVSMPTGDVVPQDVQANPLAWLLRHRQFGNAYEFLRDQKTLWGHEKSEEFERLRGLLEGLHSRQSGGDARVSKEVRLDPPTVEELFFDQVASGGIQATMLGRAWLEDRFESLGGTLQEKKTLGETIDWCRHKNSEPCRFLKSYKFLNDRATASRSDPHPMRPLTLGDSLRLGAAEGGARARDPRRAVPGIETAIPFPATASGTNVVVLCAGGPHVGQVVQGVAEQLQALSQSILGDVSDDFLRALNDRGCGPAWHVCILSSVESKEVAGEVVDSVGASLAAADRLVAIDVSLLPEIAKARSIELARDTVQTSLQERFDPPLMAPDAFAGRRVPDSIIFVVGPGAQQMQVGALLACATLASEWGAALRIGSVQRAPDGGTDVRMIPQTFAQFPGWAATLAPAAVAMIEELEFLRAATTLDALGPAAGEAAAEARQLHTEMTANITRLGDRTEQVRIALRRLALVRAAREDKQLDPILATSVAYGVVELSLGPSRDQDGTWHGDIVSDLRNARNQSVAHHGELRHNAGRLDQLLGQVANDLAKAVAPPMDAAGTSDLVTRWRNLLTRVGQLIPATPSSAEEL